ncbi:MAG: hypothetical protein RIE52_12155 [Balneola sp.]
MSEFNDILLRLTGSRQITRKKIADVCKCSLSHVDQVFRGESDWSSCNDNGCNEWLALMQMGFDLEIPEIKKTVLSRGKTVVDFDHLEMSLNGMVEDEICDLLSIFGKVRDGKSTDNDKEQAHRLVEQLFEEVKK